MNLSPIHMQQYLERIQSSRVYPATATKPHIPTTPDTFKPSLDALAHLQMQHLLTVPFENLSVMHREPIALTTANLFDKIVRRRRGGFCYELNSLFAALLKGLGFQVQMLSAQVYQQSTKTFGPPFDHMALCVTVQENPVPVNDNIQNHNAQNHNFAGEPNADTTNGKRFLVDVGFGDSCRTPIALPAGNATDVSGTYRIRPLHGLDTGQITHDSALVLEVKNPQAANGNSHRNKGHADGWTPCYRFSMQPYAMAAFGSMCEFHSQNRDSGFTRRLICSIATPKGRYTLSNDRMIITYNGQKRELAVAHLDTYDRILEAYFGVNSKRRTK